MADEMFKTTLMGGFDKDDVLTKVQIMKDEAYAEKSKLIKEKKEKDKKIDELNKRLNLKDVQRDQQIMELREEHAKEMEEVLARLRMKEEQKDKLEQQIQVKYQKYIDRYDLIGSLILDAQEKAEKIVKEAEETRDKMLEEARIEAQKCLDAVQTEVDDKLAEGKRKYIAVQEEMNEIVELINQAQRRFMSSYREVHQIISTMPESLRELEDEVNEEVMDEGVSVDETAGTFETLQAESEMIENMEDEILDDGAEEMEEESLDEEDDIMEDEIIRILDREDHEEE